MRIYLYIHPRPLFFLRFPLPDCFFSFLSSSVHRWGALSPTPFIFTVSNLELFCSIFPFVPVPHVLQISVWTFWLPSFFSLLYWSFSCPIQFSRFSSAFFLIFSLNFFINAHVCAQYVIIGMVQLCDINTFHFWSDISLENGPKTSKVRPSFFDSSASFPFPPIFETYHLS